MALEFDSFNDEPFKGFAVATKGFARVGASMSGLDLPTLFVPEGGYRCKDPCDSLTTLSTRIEDTAAVGK
ncbi:hypothetical protein [Pseudorhodobacter sp.]|uniref:hypothetical protein n=1 Tax=Pseudorhodobacter sp. TaxID=1934400 RepID=UPI0026496636|nr:hypothetical protein [Pseudorhodobacter sp.]MDN5789217.1 hypothetical protein [Pseudorhodobacter sp.]